jgi:hypothetical protein
MGQPACKIAEADSEAQATPLENSLQSETAIDASPLGQGGKAIKSRRRKHRINVDGIDDLNLQAPHQKPLSSPVLFPMVPPSVPSMAPGVGGFNIEPPAPRAGFVKSDVDIGHVRHRALPKPNLVPQATIQAQRMAIVVESGEASLVLRLFAIIAIAIVGVVAFGFADETRKQLSYILEAMTPLYKISSVETSAHRARLVVESQKGFANEPLPLGISVRNASGVETVTVAGLANDAELSLGTSLGPAGWLVTSHDLDKTFVGTSSASWTQPSPCVRLMASCWTARLLGLNGLKRSERV